MHSWSGNVFANPVSIDNLVVISQFYQVCDINFLFFPHLQVWSAVCIVTPSIILRIIQVLLYISKFNGEVQDRSRSLHQGPLQDSQKSQGMYYQTKVQKKGSFFRNAGFLVLVIIVNGPLIKIIDSEITCEYLPSYVVTYQKSLLCNRK